MATGIGVSPHRSLGQGLTGGDSAHRRPQLSCDLFDFLELAGSLSDEPLHGAYNEMPRLGKLLLRNEGTDGRS